MIIYETEFFLRKASVDHEIISKNIQRNNQINSPLRWTIK